MKLKSKKIILISFIIGIISPNLFYAQDDVNSDTFIQEDSTEDLSNENVTEINEELQAKYEVEKQRIENIDEIEAQINSNKGEINSLREEIIKMENEIDKLEIEIHNKEENVSNILKIYQKVEMNSYSIFLYNMLLESNNFQEFLDRKSSMDMLFDALNKEILKLSDDLKKVKKNRENADKKILKLQKIETKLSDELSKLKINDDKNSSYLETVSRTSFNNQCQPNEIQGLDCGDEFEDDSFDFPIEYGYVSNEFQGWDAIEQADGHTGIDLVGDEEIHPVANGQVVDVTVDGYGGIQVLMIHNINGNNYVTNYAHLGSVNVMPGDILSKDDILGTMGETGVATGVHLHLEIIKGPYYIHSSLENPRNYLDFPTRYNDFERK